MLVRGAKSPKSNYRLLLMPFVPSQKMKVKLLLLKSLHSSDTGFGGIKLDLSWKPPCLGPALIVWEGATQASKREKSNQQTVLPSCNARNQNNNQNSKIYLRVQYWNLYVGMNTNYLIRLEAFLLRRRECMPGPVHQPTTSNGEVTDPREATTATFLTQYNL